MTGDFRYFGTVDLKVAGDVAGARAAMLDFLWQFQNRHGDDPSWRVEFADNSHSLGLRLSTRDREQAAAAIRLLGSELHQYLRQRDQDRQQQDAADVALVDQLQSQYRSDVDKVRSESERLAGEVPNESPSDRLDTLGKQLREYTEILEALRAKSNAVHARLDQLSTPLSPATVAIDPDAQQAAYDEREDLQQDLKQLYVQLTLGRRSLQQVWQLASPPLDDLIAASARLARAGMDSGRRRDMAGGAALESLDELANLYQRRLIRFSEKWTATMTALNRNPVDARAPQLMAMHARLHDLLGDFSFHAAKLLDKMRDEVVRYSDRAPTARHATVSNVKRLFHRLEAKHRRFEFVASDVYRRNNFRLDSAIKSASGLERRVTAMMQDIDAHLRAQAAATIKAKRESELTATLSQREGLRAGIDETTDRIVAMVEEYARTIPLTERYLTPSLGAKAARIRLEDADRVLRRYDTFAELLKRRQAARRQSSAIKIEIADSSLERVPAGLAGRAALAIVIAALTLGITGFVGRGRSGPPWS